MIYKYFILLIWLGFISTTADKNAGKEKSSSTAEAYKAAEGKIVGIWPDWTKWNDPIKIKELKERFGFNYIAIFPDSQKYANAATVYRPENIMGLIVSDLNDKNFLFGNLWAYYCDEPVRNGYDMNYWKQLHDKVRNFKNSKFITGDYKRGSSLKEYASFADVVMFTSYKKWNPFLFWWLPGDKDQRSSWDDMKEIFGDKFSLTWISAQEDSLEFENLLEKAKELSLNGIFLYAFDDGIEVKRIESFCNAAFKAGFLKKL